MIVEQRGNKENPGKKNEKENNKIVINCNNNDNNYNNNNKHKYILHVQYVPLLRAF